MSSTMARSALITALVCLILGCATAPPESSAGRRSDAQLVRRVKEALHADQLLLARHINVRADNGVVTLSGYVGSTEDLTQAKRDAEGVPGVGSVVDRMQVDRGAIQNAPSGP